MGCLAQGKDPRLCSQPGPGSNPALLCHLSAVTLSPCLPLVRLGAHSPSPQPQPMGGAGGFQMSPGGFLARVCGLLNGAPSQGPQAPAGPSRRTPLLTGLEHCQGVCTQSEARAGSGVAERTVTGHPRSLGQLWRCLAAC